jgi:hypothetical protein
MSFGESVFLAGFNQKTEKEDQNVKYNQTYPWWKLLQKVPEDTRRHHTAADPERMTCRAGRPHHHAAQSPMGPICQELSEYSSTASLDCIYAVS